MTILVGIIAEELSDVDVISEIIGKLARKNFGVKSFVGHGCGRIKYKCRAWAQTLKERGCKLLILVHDLDSARLDQLLAAIRGALNPSPMEQYVIVIPIRELEAWLLADHKAITKTFRFKKGLRKIANPESINRPKEFLRDIIRRGSNNRVVYVNTVHNGGPRSQPPTLMAMAF